MKNRNIYIDGALVAHIKRSGFRLRAVSPNGTVLASARSLPGLIRAVQEGQR